MNRMLLAALLAGCATPALADVPKPAALTADGVPPSGSASKLIWWRSIIGPATRCSWLTLPKRVEMSIERSAAFHPAKAAPRDSM